MSWGSYRSKGEAPGPLPKKRDEPIPKLPFRQPSDGHLRTLEAFMKELIRDDIPGADVRVEAIPHTDETFISYVIPNRTIARLRQEPEKLLQPLMKSAPHMAIKAHGDRRARRNAMAIARFRLGKFGRP